MVVCLAAMEIIGYRRVTVTLIYPEPEVCLYSQKQAQDFIGS